jgi:hypothetical protein
MHTTQHSTLAWHRRCSLGTGRANNKNHKYEQSIVTSPHLVILFKGSAVPGPPPFCAILGSAILRKTVLSFGVSNILQDFVVI